MPKLNPVQSGNEPSVVAVGGGTGLSTMLRGIKQRTGRITAIVTVSDDGGGSGRLRSELGMLPPGDIINCIQALSNAEPTLRNLLNYRFREGSLAGQSFGNLYLAAFDGISGSFDAAVSRIGEVLSITGRVLPVTNANVNLEADFDDGSTVVGETSITAYKKARACLIRNIRLTPSAPAALPESLDAIAQADLIVFGPGSLYTSIIPNLLVGGICEAVRASGAMKLYVANIMTQDGETEGFTLSDHVGELFKYAGSKLFDYCIANSAPLGGELLERYGKENASALEIDLERLNDMGVELISRPLALQRSPFARHDPDALADAIMEAYITNGSAKLYNVN